jgi:hypothetical protein
MPAAVLASLPPSVTVAGRASKKKPAPASKPAAAAPKKKGKAKKRAAPKKSKPAAAKTKTKTKTKTKNMTEEMEVEKEAEKEVEKKEEQLFIAAVFNYVPPVYPPPPTTISMDFECDRGGVLSYESDPDQDPENERCGNPRPQLVRDVIVNSDKFKHFVNNLLGR